MQRARNRRRRHRQHVDRFLHLLQAFFLGDSETLLFVDDEKAEVFEVDVFGEDAMRADDDVDLARFEFANDFFLFFRAVVTSEKFDRDRERCEAPQKRAIVLVGEDGGRREHRDLFSIHDGLERGAHRHFSFAVSDVAA